MISEALIKYGLRMFKFFAGIFPFTFDFSFDTSIINTFLDVVSTATYFFPWHYVAPILYIIVSLMTFRIAIALIRFILSFIPLMGS